jgi:hypothetical protein
MGVGGTDSTTAVVAYMCHWLHLTVQHPLPLARNGWKHHSAAGATLSPAWRLAQLPCGGGTNVRMRPTRHGCAILVNCSIHPHMRSTHTYTQDRLGELCIPLPPQASCHP